MELLRKKEYQIDELDNISLSLYFMFFDQKKRDKDLSYGSIRKKHPFLNCIDHETRELGNNLWAILNGVTRYTSNHLKGNPGFAVINGKGEEMNRKAMKILIKHS